MGPDGGGEPEGQLAEAIGDFSAFKEEFAQAGINRFGSGWAWLVWNGSDVGITSTPNQDSPLMESQTPLLGLDVWEHAYYRATNPRPDTSSGGNVVNWPAVAARTKAIAGSAQRLENVSRRWTPKTGGSTTSSERASTTVSIRLR